MTNAFAMLRLLPMNNRDKDVETLALRHQTTVPEPQLGKQKVRFNAGDRAFLTALPHRLPRKTVVSPYYWPRYVLSRLRLLAHPDTMLRWHRNLPARHHAAASQPKRPGRPRTVHSTRALVLHLAQENPSWGYRRLHGELLALEIKVAASTVWKILKETGIDPTPGARPTLQHLGRLPTLSGKHPAPHPTTASVVQAAKNLVMDLQDTGSRSRFMIRDRNGKLPNLFDAILSDTGINIVLGSVRMPRMNSIMERSVQTCRRELLNRTMIWNQRHLLHALPELEQFYNGHRPHRPHQGIANARPLHSLPAPIANPDETARLDVRRHDRLGDILHGYEHAA